MSTFTLTVMILGIISLAQVYGCDMDCWRGWVAEASKKCDASAQCTGFTFSYIAGAEGRSHWQVVFANCTDLRGFNTDAYVKVSRGQYQEHGGFYLHCGQSLPTWDPPMPDIVDCKDKDYSKKRHNTLWLPGLPPHTSAQDLIESLIHKNPGTYDGIAAPWAFWNSKWNAKCPNPTEGLCGRAFPADIQPLVTAAQAAGWRIIPMLQVCGLCVLNGTWDWRPAMKILLEDATTNKFDGFVLDMELGGWWNQSGRASFLNTFADMVHTELGSDSTVDWFSHWRWWPDLSFPNSADYCHCMDTYGQEKFVGYWLKMFQCQAGIGLEYPGQGTAKDMDATFNSLIGKTHLRSIGTWGPVTDDGSAMSKVWFTNLQRWLKSS